MRVWVLDAGPNTASAFHVVGGQFDTVYLEGGYRLRPSDPGGSQALALGGDGSVPGTRVEVTELPGYPPWPANEGSRSLGETACALGRDLGLTLVAGRRGGGSDGCHLWDLVPTLDGLGPVGRNPHVATGTDPESVDPGSFEPRAKLAAALLRKLLA